MAKAIVKIKPTNECTGERALYLVNGQAVDENGGNPIEYLNNHIPNCGDGTCAAIIGGVYNTNFIKFNNVWTDLPAGLTVTL